MLGQEYKPLFNVEQLNGQNNFYKIYHGDFIKSDTGTGAVHIAPMYGEDDFNLCLKYNLIDQNGKNLFDYLTSCGELIDSIGKMFDQDYVPTVCYQNNTKIIRFIKSNYPELFVKVEQMEHSYPHCWRTNTPLIYRAQNSWFVQVTKFKDELVELNKTINWYPKHVGEARFHNWLESARDWNISRARYWGTPIPIWKEINGNSIIIVKSLSHLEELCNIPKGSLEKDVHRDKIDHLIIHKDGKEYKRIDDVFDCWFESGCVPLYFSPDNEYIPADFIAEGIDQTRGWFYTLLVLGYVCSKVKNNKPVPAFKNVIVNGLLLASDGKKMSKSLKNYLDPQTICQRYGADSLRMFLLSNSGTDDLKFNDEKVRDILKGVLIPYYNTLEFMQIYKTFHYNKLSEFKNMDFQDINKMEHPFNAWLLYKTYVLETNIHKAYNSYQLNLVIKYVVEFVEILNNRYIKLNRPIIKNEDQDPNINNLTIECIVTINFVMLRLAYLLCPVAPYFAEYIYKIVKPIFVFCNDKLSIHLTYYDDFYKLFDNNISKELMEKIDYIDYEFKLLDYVRKIRTNINYPQSKTLKKAYYYTNDFNHITNEFIDEMNLDTIIIHKLSDLTFNPIRLVPTIDNKNLCQVFRKDSQKVKQLILDAPNDVLEELYNGKSIKLDTYDIIPNMISDWSYDLIKDGDTMLLNHINPNNEDKQIEKLIGSNFILFVDYTYDLNMMNSYYVKTVARKFQELRNLAGFKPWDPVKLVVQTDNKKVLDIFSCDKFLQVFCLIRKNIE